ncbi:NAC domain-containing protein 68-like [Miscanthus floridulus]|uniref:NAC domain-containing protein 68-like n=1 Tax=Miscanthus floridulus TaxID=154761 RepID=UPI00345A9E2D
MSAAEALGLPPGVRFDPTGDELVEFYLLPRALGRPPAVPGIIIEDDTATTSTSAEHPWKLLTRHRRTDDSEAYFFERVAAGSGETTKGGGAGARQDRRCGGRWTWVGQKRAPDEALPPRGDGEHVSWGKYSLNLQEGSRRRGGSTGWVMHEYTVASPQCPLLPVKLCHVSFTGHGQKRQRVPDDDSEGQELEPQAATAPQHKRAATGCSMVTTATAMPNQELSEARAQQNQEQQFPIYDYDTSSIGHFWSSDAGFSQESSIILDPSYPDARSNHQEPFALDQQLTQIQQCSASQSQAYHQEQFMFMNPAGSSTEAHCAVQSASDLGSRRTSGVASSD